MHITLIMIGKQHNKHKNKSKYKANLFIFVSSSYELNTLGRPGNVSGRGGGMAAALPPPLAGAWPRGAAFFTRTLQPLHTREQRGQGLRAPAPWGGDPGPPATGFQQN